MVSKELTKQAVSAGFIKVGFQIWAVEKSSPLFLGGRCLSDLLSLTGASFNLSPPLSYYYFLPPNLPLSVSVSFSLSSSLFSSFCFCFSPSPSPLPPMCVCMQILIAVEELVRALLGDFNLNLKNFVFVRQGLSIVLVVLEFDI